LGAKVVSARRELHEVWRSLSHHVVHHAEDVGIHRWVHAIHVEVLWVEIWGLVAKVAHGIASLVARVEVGWWVLELVHWVAG
jgi:hypothetical protein